MSLVPKPSPSHEAERSCGEQDDRLWQSASRGDAAAREQLCALALDSATRCFHSLRVPREEVDDLVAEVHLSVLRHVESGARAPENLRGFLWYRARGVCTAWRRSRRRAGAAQVESAPAATEADPGSGIERSEAARALQECLGTLVEDARTIFLANRVAGRT